MKEDERKGLDEVVPLVVAVAADAAAADDDVDVDVNVGVDVSVDKRAIDPTKRASDVVDSIKKRAIPMRFGYDEIT